MDSWHKVENWYTVENWYHLESNKSYINLKMLTNEIVNDENFSVPINFYDSIEIIRHSYLDESILDINNLLKKIPNVKSFRVPYDIRIPITELSKTVENIIYENNNFTNLEEYINLKDFGFYNYGIKFIVPRFADGLKTISIMCESIEGSLAFLPSSVEKITLNIQNLNTSLDMWPLNLKQLYISIGSNTNSYTIEMLPHELECFSLHASSYKNYIDYPPNLKLLHFIVDDDDSPYITGIPDTVVNYAIKYISQKEIDRLPKKCKIFTYLGCPLDVQKNLHRNVKGVAFYTKRIKNLDY